MLCLNNSLFGFGITKLLLEVDLRIRAVRTYVCSVCACLDLSVSSSSWGLGWAAVCD